VTLSDCFFSEPCVGMFRTGAVAEARQLVQLFGWQQYFCAQEIYPGDKTAHFRRSLDSVLFVSFSRYLSVDLCVMCILLQ